MLHPAIIFKNAVNRLRRFDCHAACGNSGRSRRYQHSGWPSQSDRSSFNLYFCIPAARPYMNEVSYNKKG
ncbi:MAG: hypothetical protein OP8BY_1238 [Candidatus Saccharicenans subterraneus]|uniref:Uncharacterized protein n=1 Tax=Candidatus Saccharicenans subterraneus TaxID=2508984 RepID=A0A3E2BPG2_9BACT|nr:MAG: hypothetical protein OP8BY_1238 [Candidatus Saccharicenans subterraneum]